MTFPPEDVLAFLSLPKPKQRAVVKYISRLEEILDEHKRQEAAAKRVLAQSLSAMEGVNSDPEQAVRELRKVASRSRKQARSQDQNSAQAEGTEGVVFEIVHGGNDVASD
jgi:ABC-type nitrate/sulfonate/bicarbonate transport system substrate-binding protein